jgi:hypothetical protein
MQRTSRCRGSTRTADRPPPAVPSIHVQPEIAGAAAVAGQHGPRRHRLRVIGDLFRGNAGEQPAQGIAGRNSSVDDEMARCPPDAFSYLGSVLKQPIVGWRPEPTEAALLLIVIPDPTPFQPRLTHVAA